MTNLKLYLIPTTPTYENKKKIFYARQIEKHISPANVSLSYKH